MAASQAWRWRSSSAMSSVRSRRSALMRSWRSWARVCLRRGIIADRSVSGFAAWAGRSRSPVGCGQRGKHRRAVGFGAVDVPGRGREHDRAVGQLAVGPAADPGVERLDQMMNPAVMLDVRRMRRTPRVRHRVVDVGLLDRFIAARPTTRQIPPPNELLGPRARPIPRIRGGIGRHRQRFQLGVFGHLTHGLGGQNSEPAQIPRRITSPVKGGLFGEHMNHRR